MRINQIIVTENQEQLDELSWKDIQRGAKKVSKGAQKFTKNVADTGAAVGQAAKDVGGAIKQVGKTAIADPVSATYNAAKSGLNKAADVTSNVYGDVKAGAQRAGRGAATVAGDVAGAAGAVAGGATTGVGRAAVKGFNTGVQNTGGDAVDNLQTNVFTKTGDPIEIKSQIKAKQDEIKGLEQQLAQAEKSAGGSTTGPLGSFAKGFAQGVGATGTAQDIDQFNKAAVDQTQATPAAPTTAASQEPVPPVEPAQAATTPAPTTATAQKPGYDTQTGIANDAMMAQNRAAGKASAPYGFDTATGKPLPAPKSAPTPNFSRGQQSVTPTSVKYTTTPAKKPATQTAQPAVTAESVDIAEALWRKMKSKR